jgi:hypothetical protein
MKNANNLYLTIIIFLSATLLYLLWERESINERAYESKFIKYLDSMNSRNELLFAKVDSLQKVKTQLYSEYTKVKLKYDTVQIAIDTMPDLEGTKLLLSISRQLTAKGVE